MATSQISEKNFSKRLRTTDSRRRTPDDGIQTTDSRRTPDDVTEERKWVFALTFKPLYLCNPMIFQTMNSVKSKSLSLKYQRLTPASAKILGLDNLSLWQKLSSFRRILYHELQAAKEGHALYPKHFESVRNFILY